MAVYFIDEAKSRPRQSKGSNKKSQSKNISKGQPVGLSPIPQNYTVETTRRFDKDAQHLSLTKQEIDELKQFGQLPITKVIGLWFYHNFSCSIALMG